MGFAGSPARLSRLARDISRDGPLRLAAEYARRRWSRATDDRIIVWENPHDAEPQPAVGHAPYGLWVGRYDRPEDVPPTFYTSAEAEEGSSAIRRFLDEFADVGVLWVPWLAGRPAGYQWTRRGDRVRPWHFPLCSETTLLFSMVTFRPFRGRKVAGRTLTEVCRREVQAGGRVVGESFVWNTASVRTFESAGFRRLSVHRPYAGYPD